MALYSIWGPMLKLKLQCLDHQMWRTDSLEKTLMLGKIEGRRRRGQQRMRWLDGITDSMDMSFSQVLGVGDGEGGLVCCRPWGQKESDTTERLQWTEAEMHLFKDMDVAHGMSRRTRESNMGSRSPDSPQMTLRIAPVEVTVGTYTTGRTTGF